MNSRYKHNSNSNLSQNYHSLQSRNGFPNGQQQTHLLNLWTTNSVDQTYQNLFLVFIETLKNQRQQNKKIEIEIKKTYQKSSLYFLLKQNLNLRQQIKSQIQTQIVHETEGNNYKKPQKIDIILRQLCDKIKNLRRINLLVSQTLIKIFQEFKMSRQTNIGSLGKQYIEIFIQIDAQNDFLKESFLNEFILFQKGYDPFFLIHYQQTMKARNSQALKKYKPIEQLFDLNISYVYRLMRAQQKMLKYMLLIDQMSNTQKDQKQLVNKQKLIKLKNNQRNNLQLPLINNRSSRYDQQTISRAQTIRQYGIKALPLQPRFQREIQQQEDQQDSSYQRRKIKSLKPIKSVQLQPIDMISKNKSAYYTPKQNADQRSRSVDFSSSINNQNKQLPLNKNRILSQAEQNPLLHNSKLKPYLQQKIISPKFNSKMKNTDSLSSSQQKKWNQKKLKNMRPYLKPIKTQRSSQQSDQMSNQMNQNNQNSQEQQNYQSSKNSSIYRKHKRSKLSEQQDDESSKNKQKYLSKQRLNQIMKRKPVEIQQERRPRRKKENDSPDDYKKDKYSKDKKRKRQQSEDQYDQRQYKRALDKKRRQSSQNSSKRSPQKQRQKISSKKKTKQSKEKQKQKQKQKQKERQKSKSRLSKQRKQQSKYRETQNSQQELSGSQNSKQQDKIDEQSQYSSNQQKDNRKNKKEQQSEQQQQQQEPPKSKQKSKNDKSSSSPNKKEEKPSPQKNESKTKKTKQQQKPTKQDKDRSITQLKKQPPKKDSQTTNKNNGSKNIVSTDQNRPLSEKTSPTTNLTKKQEPKNNPNNKQAPTQEQQEQSQQQSQDPNSKQQNKQDKINKNASNLNSNSKIKMIPGKINYTELENYLKDKKIMSPYDNTFKQNFRFIMSSSLNTQTYLSQFMLNQQLAAFSLCSPTASGNMVIYLWAPIQKVADQKSSVFFFKKYIDYLQKQTTFKSIVYRGQQIPQVMSQKFVLQKQKLYVRKRQSNVARESFQFQYFFSYQISNISFKQVSKNSLLYSDEIDPFTESNSWCNPTILNSIANQLQPQFKDQWIIDEKVKTIKEINSILQKDSYDTFQIGQQKQMDFDFINMSRSMATIVPRQGFISNQGYMIVVGKNLVSPDNTKSINKMEMLKDVVLYFGKGFKSAQQLANIIMKYKQKLKQQECKFAFKMFSKQLYGKYLLNQPKLSSQRAYYCNWDLNFAWRDQIPGKLIHNINSVKQIYGPQNFILVIQSKGVLSLAVQITKQDFLY